MTLVVHGCGGIDDQANPPAVGGRDASASDAAPATDAADEVTEFDAAEPVCVPMSCAEVGAICGSIPDGCGDKISCGQCPIGQACGGGGPNLCGTNACNPKTCAQAGASCGFVGDGCADAINCGGCAAPQTCGGGGNAHQCGCQPKSCVALGANCGTAPDGCGAIVDCGACLQGQLCGGAGTNKCGTGTCAAKTCAQLSASCGVVSDSCSQAIDCGACLVPAVCGGEGKVNQCGCAAKTCAQLGASCGGVPNGCGQEIDCGDCPSGSVCGADGVPNQCGCTCITPPNADCYEATGACDPGTGSCVYQPKSNTTVCGTTSCPSFGTCQWAGECSKSGTQSRVCTDYVCTNGTCGPLARPESKACARVIADGTACAIGYCCTNTCVARNSKTHCGSCGVDCGTAACTKITGLTEYSCACVSNLFCQGAGFGSLATCYTANGQSLCNCQCPSGTSCTGQCGGAGICSDVTGHNYCHY